MLCYMLIGCEFMFLLIYISKESSSWRNGSVVKESCRRVKFVFQHPCWAVITPAPRDPITASGFSRCLHKGIHALTHTLRGK